MTKIYIDYKDISVNTLLNNAKTKLNNIIKWLEKSQEDYSNFDNELNIKESKIQKISIKRRHNIVK